MAVLVKEILRAFFEKLNKKQSSESSYKYIFLSFLFVDLIYSIFRTDSFTCYNQFVNMNLTYLKHLKNLQYDEVNYK